MDCYAGDILREIEEQKQVKIVSLDIFDTLLFRAVKSPSDVFELIGSEALKRGFLREHIRPVEYRNLRKRLEKNARDHKKSTLGTNEVSLKDIYSFLPEYIGDRDKLLELEIETEQEVCYLNPTMAEVIHKIKALGKRIILLSDMYLSKQQISDILTYNELDIKDISEIFVSSEHSLTKKEGSFYTHVLEQLHVMPEEVFHIGDNYISDVVNAKDKGINACHYSVISNEDVMELQMEALKYGNTVPEIYSLRKYAAALGDGYEDEHRKWFRIGALTMGPLLSGAAEWVLDQAEENDIHTIFPLMREGKILGKMLEKALAYRDYKCKIAPMYLSRKAIFLPSLKEFNEEALKQVLYIKKANIKNLFEMLQIEHDKSMFQDLLELPLSDFRKRVNDGDDRAKELIDHLLSDDIRRIINHNIEKTTKAAMGYLKELGITNPFLTVDIGYRGTMQRGLEQLLKKEGLTDNHNIHTLIFGHYDSLDKILEGTDIRGYIGSYGANEETITEITHRPYIIEQLMMCEEGTTIGYEAERDKNVPRLKHITCFNEEQLQYIHWVQEGMLQYQKYFLKIKAQKLKMEKVKEKPEELVKLVLRLMTMPTLIEAQCLGKLTYDDNYGADVVQYFCNKEDFEIIRIKGLEYYIKTAYPGKAAWMEGIVVQSDPTYFINKIIENSSSDYEKSILKVVKQAVGGGARTIVIIGAGEAGRMMQKYLNIYGIHIEAFIDNNKKLQGYGICGIPVCSMEAPFHTNDFVIGSFAFVEELIKQARRTIGQNINLYYYGKEVSDGSR